MENLGYYARREGPESDSGERVCLTCVVDEWDDGFAIDTYLAVCKGVSFEDAVWCGKKLDYSTLGYAINRKKYIFVRDMVDECRKERETLMRTCRQDTFFTQDMQILLFKFGYSEKSSSICNRELYIQKKWRTRL